jgi:hypothetical protein
VSVRAGPLRTAGEIAAELVAGVDFGTSDAAVTLMRDGKIVTAMERMTEAQVAFAEDLSEMARRVRRATEELSSLLAPDPELIERVTAVARLQGFTGARAERRLVDGETPAGWFAVATTPGRGDVWQQVEPQEAQHTSDAWLDAFRAIGVAV